MPKGIFSGVIMKIVSTIAGLVALLVALHYMGIDIDFVDFLSVTKDKFEEVMKALNVVF